MRTPGAGPPPYPFARLGAHLPLRELVKTAPPIRPCQPAFNLPHFWERLLSSAKWGCPYVPLYAWGPWAPRVPIQKMPFDGQSVASAVPRHLSSRPPPAEGRSVTSVPAALLKDISFVPCSGACLASSLPKPAPLPHPSTPPPENPQLVCGAAVRFGKESTGVGMGVGGVFEGYKELVTFWFSIFCPRPAPPQSQQRLRILNSRNTGCRQQCLSFYRRVLPGEHFPVGSSRPFLPLEHWYSNHFRLPPEFETPRRNLH